MVKKPIISFKGIPENQYSENVIFDMEDEINNICRSFSLNNKNQETQKDAINHFLVILWLKE